MQLDHFLCKYDRDEVEYMTNIMKEKLEKMRQCLAFNRKYDATQIKYGFISNWKEEWSKPLQFDLCSVLLCNDAMKPSKMICHLDTKCPT